MATEQYPGWTGPTKTSPERPRSMVVLIFEAKVVEEVFRANMKLHDSGHGCKEIIEETQFMEIWKCSRYLGGFQFYFPVVKKLWKFGFCNFLMENISGASNQARITSNKLQRQWRVKTREDCDDHTLKQPHLLEIGGHVACGSVSTSLFHPGLNNGQATARGTAIGGGSAACRIKQDKHCVVYLISKFDFR